MPPGGKVPLNSRKKILFKGNIRIFSKRKKTPFKYFRKFACHTQDSTRLIFVKITLRAIVRVNHTNDISVTNLVLKENDFNIICLSRRLNKMFIHSKTH